MDKRTWGKVEAAIGLTARFLILASVVVAILRLVGVLHFSWWLMLLPIPVMALITMALGLGRDAVAEANDNILETAGEPHLMGGTWFNVASAYIVASPIIAAMLAILKLGAVPGISWLGVLAPVIAAAILLLVIAIIGGFKR